MNVVPAKPTARHELRLYSMDGNGDLKLLSSDELADDVTQFVFHPSGRFLYASDAAQRLLGYAIDSGRLQRIEDIDHAGGSLAITLTRD